MSWQTFIRGLKLILGSCPHIAAHVWPTVVIQAQMWLLLLAANNQ
jgi:hypothetical protein